MPHIGELLRAAKKVTDRLKQPKRLFRELSRPRGVALLAGDPRSTRHGPRLPTPIADRDEQLLRPLEMTLRLVHATGDMCRDPQIQQGARHAALIAEGFPHLQTLTEGLDRPFVLVLPPRHHPLSPHLRPPPPPRVP